MKIAYLTGEYPKVSHTFILREARALRALGLDIAACSIRETRPADRPGAAEAEEHAAVFHVLKAARNPLRLVADHAAAFLSGPGRYLSALGLALRTGGPGARARLYQLFYFAEAGVLARRLRREGVDHLHNHFANSSCTVAMLASALSGVPFSFTLHGPSIFFEPRRWRIDEKIARARFVACISHFCRSQAMLFSDPADWPKLKIVHCGVDPAAYDAPRAPGAGLRLLFVGRLAAVKGVAVLLDAFDKVAAAHPAATLALVGDGPERAALARHAAGLASADRIAFRGALSQEAVAAELRAADIFVLPSFAEGVPVALMEAMAARIPVIATRVGGVAELVEDGANGLLVAPGDGAALAAALSRLIGDDDLRARMGAAGRETVLAGFDAAAEAAWLAALFRGAAAGALPAGLRPAARGR